MKQVSAFEHAPKEYFIDKITNHYGKGKDALFKVAWTSGDFTWMTYRDAVKADILKSYCEAMGVSGVDALPKGKSGPPDDTEIYCGMMGFEGIKERVFSLWGPSKSPSNYNNPINHTIASNNSMSYQFSEEELNDFFAYDANRAIRLVAEDEGKPFSRILPKPAGYDDWVSRDGTISVANWISEKKHQGELDVTELGRRVLKRTLFRSLAPGPSFGMGRPRNGIRRALAFKPGSGTSNLGFVRPGTPYPKINGVPLVAGPGGTIQLMGNGVASYPLPDSTGGHSYATTTSTYNNDGLATENHRLRRELEELRSHEVSNNRPGQQGPANRYLPDGMYFANRELFSVRDIYLLLFFILEVGLNIMGLSVADAPVVSPIPERAYHSGEETNMVTN